MGGHPVLGTSPMPGAQVLFPKPQTPGLSVRSSGSQGLTKASPQLLSPYLGGSAKLELMGFRCSKRQEYVPIS